MIRGLLIFSVTGLFFLAGLSSCKNGQEQGESPVRAVVPVTVASPRTGRMAKYTELMAVSAFQVKAVIKSPVSGYVAKCVVTPGDKVLKDQVLFLLQTREARALQQSGSVSAELTGTVSMNAALEGVISTIDHPQGDYVQEGDALATVIVPGSLVFLLEVPYEMRAMVHTGAEFNLKLPDNTVISAVVRSVLPSMSGTSQTQQVVLKPRSVTDLPENLMAKVKIVQTAKNNAVILPKICLLSDEIMKNFWVMKLINDSTAVKIPVVTGMQGIDSVEVVSPVFGTADRILSGGNYGLGDTAIVRIMKHE